MATNHRPKLKSMAIIRHTDRILATPGVDTQTGQKFYRLLGGHVEMGETTAQALIRELREELGISAALSPAPVAWIENIFTYNGEVGHEVIALYHATLASDDLHETYPILDVPDLHAEWVNIPAILSGATVIYPTEFRAYL